MIQYEFSMFSLSFSLIFCEFIICFAKSLLIHYIFREFTMDPLSFLCFYYGVTIFLAESLWIHFMFRDHSLEVHHLLRKSPINSPGVSGLYYEFTFCFKITMYLLLVSRIDYSLLFLRIHFEFTIVFAKSLRIYYHIYEFTMNSLSFSRIHFQFAICFANSLSFSRIHYGSIIFAW